MLDNRFYSTRHLSHTGRIRFVKSEIRNCYYSEYVILIYGNETRIIIEMIYRCWVNNIGRVVAKD